jgi:putative membrane protein
MKGHGPSYLGRLACLLSAGLLVVGFARAEPTRTPQDRAPMQPQSGQGPQRVASAAGVQYLSHQDRRFVTQALESGIAKVREVQLAERQAVSPDVRRAADHLQSEQMLANAELERIASNHGVVAPKEATEDRRAQYSRLRSLSGANFDKEFLRSQLSTHNRALQLYQRAQLESTSRTVKMFVTAMLPKIRHNIAMLESAQAKGNAAAPARDSSGSALNEPVSPVVDAAVTPPQPQ